MLPPILDATCGSRMMWFDKDNHDALYVDKRREEISCGWDKNNSESKIIVKPDVMADFTNLPFPDDTFYLVLFDPPHLRKISDKAWIRKKYGVLPDDWEPLIRDGFNECMRVLRPFGTLIFKWSENVQDERGVSVRSVINAIGQTPLFGTRCGTSHNTIWMTFMKEGETHGR